MKVKFKKLHPDAKEPVRAHKNDAGMDLTAISLYRNCSKGYIEYGTGLSVEIPKGFVGLIFPRSSICFKNQMLTNHVGVIDSGYRGEIKFKFKVIEKDIVCEYEIGDKVGQLIIIPYPEIELEEVNELSETERGESGFGSSSQ